MTCHTVTMNNYRVYIHSGESCTTKTLKLQCLEITVICVSVTVVIH